MIPFPDIDPIALSLGPVEIRWYGISYVIGIVLGLWYARSLIKRHSHGIQLKDMDDFFVWLTFAIVIGGRLGYVIFYEPLKYLEDPLAIVQTWQGGMSFHGGLIGVSVAIIWFCWRRDLKILALGDVIACGTPLGLFFGRVANFINGELYGRPTDVPWAIIFPTGGPVPRHPSQLYEAALEGVLLFGLLYFLERTTRWRLEKPGLLFGIFLMGYGVARSISELYREPTAFVETFGEAVTWGQILSLPVFLVGAVLFIYVLFCKPDCKGDCKGDRNGN